jgi:hypothetical protein
MALLMHFLMQIGLLSLKPTAPPHVPCSSQLADFLQVRRHEGPHDLSPRFAVAAASRCRPVRNFCSARQQANGTSVSALKALDRARTRIQPAEPPIVDTHENRVTLSAMCGHLALPARLLGSPSPPPPSSSTNYNSSPPIPSLISLLAGMISGAVGVGVAYPFDSITSRLQTSADGLPGIYALLRTRGIAPLYDGVHSTMLGQALIKGALFGAYQFGQTALLPAGGAPTLLITAMAAAFGGATSAFIVTPVERVKVVMQAADSAARFASPLACLRQIVAKDGLRGLLCRGLGVTILRQVPTDIFYLVTFEVCTAELRRSMRFAASSPLVPLIAGAAAGVMAWLPVYPIDVVKTNMQAAIGGQRESMIGVALRLWQARGAWVFCEGLAPKLVRAIVNHAFTFMTMEQLKLAYQRSRDGSQWEQSGLLSSVRAFGCHGKGVCAAWGPLSGGTVIALLLVLLACAQHLCGSICRWRGVRNRYSGACTPTAALLLTAVAVFALDPRPAPPPLTKLCPPREDFLSYVRDRDWLNATNYPHGPPWVAAVQNKVLGAVFARSVGVRTPRVLFCGSLRDLPETWPSTWGGRFVCKPLWGHSSLGVLILIDGVDVSTGRPFAGRRDVAAIYEHRNGSSSKESDLLQHQRNALVIIEELVQSFRGDVPPKDHKFYMIAGRAAGMYVTAVDPGGSRVHDSCEAWFAADGSTRIDRHGCISRTRGLVPGRTRCDKPGCRQRPSAGKALCARSPPPLPPPVWARLLGTAQKLSDAIGVPYRIDLFVSADGTPVLGEFTARPMSGNFHCAVPDHPTTGMPDFCHLGRLWASYGREGGVSLPPPPVFQAFEWKKLITETNNNEICRLAHQYLLS